MALTAPALTTLRVGELQMRVAEAGAGEPIVLLHGFPELWFSWRHQLSALAGAGYRAIAPNQRGYDGTTAPADVEAYDILDLTADVVALLDALDLERAVVIGHDWGAVVAWSTALIHPERVRAVVGLSVPHLPRPPKPYLDFFRETMGDDFYMLWFQTSEPDEAFARDVPRALAGGWVDDRESWRERPVELPRWLTAEASQVFVDAFSESGFTAPLNWYRNFNRNWELLAEFDDRRVEQPALFITGSRDPVSTFMPPHLMRGYVPDLREIVVVEGAGHWVQQERPDEVNQRLIDFLRTLP